MKRSTIYTTIGDIAQLTETADVIDAKVYDGNVGLQPFIASFLDYYPAWIKALYRVRQGFVRLLGMRQEGIPAKVALQPECVPMTAGSYAGFFRVISAEPDRYWLASASDSHLTAYIAIVVTPMNSPSQHTEVVTLVRYHNWAGPIYFNIIRPFHHLVVNRMARHGLRYGKMLHNKRQSAPA
jgi:hypothetical protein